jgi:hypothetical protein
MIAQPLDLCLNIVGEFEFGFAELWHAVYAPFTG